MNRDLNIIPDLPHPDHPVHQMPTVPEPLHMQFPGEVTPADDKP